MRRHTVIAVIMSVLCSVTDILIAAAQTPEVSEEERVLDIPAVTVTGYRSVKDTGITQTIMDSVALRDNIALSMADILSFNSSLFVKNCGRATLSTVSFRGTSPSHTQVTWNGMRINNPMLGMTDFSMIPAYFIDDARLLHGTSSVSDTGGGLGGAVKLATKPVSEQGLTLQFVQGVGSYLTFDDFLRLNYADDRWQVSTRAVYSSSRNDYKYRNHDKKENIYDENMNIVGSYYPIERNLSGSFRDLHLLQEVYYNTGLGDRIGLNAWYINSNRELPLQTTDYADATAFDNRQREETLRGILSWEHLRSEWKLSLKAGYAHTWLAYDYSRDIGNGIMAVMTRSRSYTDTFYAEAHGEYAVCDKWFFTADIAAYQHLVRSRDKHIIKQQGNRAIVGYNKGRAELSGALSVKWRPVERFGIGAVVRGEMYGTAWAPPIPALFIDGVVSERGNITLRASASRNFRFPTLNDLYFLPGGNPDLRYEKGWSYDGGISFATSREGIFSLSGSATWFESRVDDWIIWLPTAKGFFSPRNLKSVHAYGTELQASLHVQFASEWSLNLDGTFSWTPSVNCGEKLSPADNSVGKQLPYIPRCSAAVSGCLSWRRWSLLYKWCYYSERFTMSSNETSLTGKLPPYYMNNLSLEKCFVLRRAELSLKGTINNLFNEDYLSVLSHPMPGINFEFFIGIKPHWDLPRRK